MFLVIKAPPLARIYQIAVIRNGSSGKPLQHETTVTFGQEAPIKASMLAFNADRRRVHLINLTSEEFSKAMQAASVRIKGGRELDRTFALSSMPALLSTLRTCVTGLEAHWGGVMETPKGPEPVRPPKGNLAGIFTSNDYPDEAVDQLQQGSVQMILLVDEQGRVADCTLSATSGVAVLDAQACYVVKERARFQPASGPDGKPARGIFRQTISWRMQ
jgi:TonB family protein